jgi:hypothetical protein
VVIVVALGSFPGGFVIHEDSVNAARSLPGPVPGATTTYPVVFIEAGLPGGVGWGVTIGGSLYFNTSGSPVVANLPDGSYAYAIGDVPGYHQPTLPYSGTITVSGAPVTEPTLRFALTVYLITLSEVGLPSGTNWSVQVNGSLHQSTTSSISWSLPNGTYGYVLGDVDGYHQSTIPYSGSILVNGGSITFPTVVFVPVTYSVTWTEAGLPINATWGVTISGSLYFGLAGQPILVPLVNGTYPYSVVDVAGYHQTTLPYAGTVVIGGTALREPTLVFGAVVYTATFNESGLPLGPTWGVTVSSARSGQQWTGSEAAGNPIAIPGLTNGSYAYALSPTPDFAAVGSSGALTIAGGDTQTMVTFVPAPYTVRFQESGLASGIGWSATIGIVTGMAIGPDPILLWEPSGSYTYSIGAVAGYSVIRTGTADVNGANLTINVTFHPVTYPVVFTQTGLPSGSSWGVTLNGTDRRSTDGSIGFSVPNGTWSYTVDPVPGWHLVGGYSGDVNVSGAGASVALPFLETTYGVVFSETGLSVGLGWSVTLNGTLRSATAPAAVTFSEPNGSFLYTISRLPGFSTPQWSGGVVVSDQGVTVPVPFAVVTYAVTFSETGLPSTTNWSVTISGAVHASTTDEILIPLSNGTYPYTISDVPGWHLVQGSAYSGSVAVSGIPAPVVDLTFAETTYEVTFSEQGLPGGTNWSVVVDGQAHASLTSAIEVALANGTHSYTVQPPSGYTANPASGEEVVSGAAATVPIAVASTGGSGSASFPFWIVVVVAGVAVVVVVGVIVLLRRR